MSRSQAPLEVRPHLLQQYPDVLTSEALAALEALAPFNRDRRRIMAARIERRAGRALRGERIAFLDPESLIPRTAIRVADARTGNFTGGAIPPHLQRPWLQRTG